MDLSSVIESSSMAFTLPIGHFKNTILAHTVCMRTPKEYIGYFLQKKKCTPKAMELSLIIVP